MLNLMSLKTCKICHIPEEYITEMTEGCDDSKDPKRKWRTIPWTEIHIVNPKEGHDYKIKVVESKQYINYLIKKERDKDVPADEQL